MHDHDEHVVVVSKFDKTHAKEWRLREVEAASALFQHELLRVTRKLRPLLSCKGSSCAMRTTYIERNRLRKMRENT